MIGLSGGKDSLILSLALALLKKRSPVGFTLRACLIDQSNGAMEPQRLSDYMEQLGIPVKVLMHPTYQIMKQREERSLCSLARICAAASLQNEACCCRLQCDSAGASQGRRSRNSADEPSIWRKVQMFSSAFIHELHEDARNPPADICRRVPHRLKPSVCCLSSARAARTATNQSAKAQKKQLQNLRLRCRSLRATSFTPLRTSEAPKAGLKACSTNNAFVRRYVRFLYNPRGYPCLPEINPRL